MAKRSTSKNKNIKGVQNVVKNMPVPVEAQVQPHIPFEIQLTRIQQDILSWRTALITAENWNYPNRQELIRLFRDVVMDAQVSACMQVRKNAMLSSKFVVKKNDKVDEALTRLIEKKWFYDFIDLSLDSIFWGFSLIQFGEIKDFDFVGCELACLRQYVKQEFDLVVPTPSQIQGFNFKEPPLNEWAIGVGHKRDLGLLSKIAPLYLYKKQAMSSWANYANLFGVPVRVAKLNKFDAETFNQMRNFLSEMGNSAFAIMNKNDDIELLETGKTSGQDVFDKYIERANSEIAKLIIGQTGSMDEKSFVGAAEVHERVAEMYAEADEMFLNNVFTHQLIPFLVDMHGFPFDGCTIEIEDRNEIDLIQRSKIDLELIKTGRYMATSEYLQRTYGSELEVVAAPKEDQKK